MLDTIPEAEEKAGVTPEQKEQRQTARRIGRVILAQSHKAAHPDASGKEIRDAVAAQKDQQVKAGKQLLKALEKAGLTVTFKETSES